MAMAQTADVDRILRAVRPFDLQSFAALAWNTSWLARPVQHLAVLCRQTLTSATVVTLCSIHHAHASCLLPRKIAVAESLRAEKEIVANKSGKGREKEKNKQFRYLPVLIAFERSRIHELN